MRKGAEASTEFNLEYDTIRYPIHTFVCGPHILAVDVAVVAVIEPLKTKDDDDD